MLHKPYSIAFLYAQPQGISAGLLQIKRRSVDTIIGFECIKFLIIHYRMRACQQKRDIRVIHRYTRKSLQLVLKLILFC